MGPNGQQGTYTQPAVPHTSSAAGKVILLVIVAIIIAGASFYAGVAYEKGHVGTTPGRFGAGGGQGMGAFGTVSAISGSSITVNNSRTGSASTFTITSATTVTDNGSSSSVSAIQDGDTVIVRTSGPGSTTASQIMVNPAFGGGAGASQVTPSAQP